MRKLSVDQDRSSFYSFFLMPPKLFTVQNFEPSFWKKAFQRASDIQNGYYILDQSLHRKKIGLLFFEPSSRTRWSFEKACLELGLSVMTSVVDQNTSLAKGETSKDTLQLYMNLGFDLIVMRSKAKESLNQIISTSKQCSFINAGFGQVAHPTQVFLDYFTWETEVPGVVKKVLILGDIKHSRVARSHLRLAQILNYEVGLYAFKGFELSNEEEKELKPSKVFLNREEALKWADAVMCLRVQKERHKEVQPLNLESPLQKHELGKDQYILHPGPFVRGEDLEDALIEDEKSLIFKQQKNGVFCRAALLSLLLEE